MGSSTDFQNLGVSAENCAVSTISASAEMTFHSVVFVVFFMSNKILS